MDAAALKRWSDTLKVVLLDVAEAVDAWRMAPRAFVLFYLYELHKITLWFMVLPDPKTEQAIFTSAVWGFLIPILTWYFSTGRKWEQRLPSPPVNGSLF